MSTDYRTLFTG